MSSPAAVLAASDRLAPQPLLSQKAESQLGPRHRQVLDELEELFRAKGFASFTVAELAAGVGCSRRTLYELASSKDSLVLLVLDRFLHRIGRSALSQIGPDASAADRIRQYMKGGIDLLGQATAFADDLADDPAARGLVDRHFRFVMTVLEYLVAAGVDAGEFRDANPAIVAGAIAGSGLYITQPDVARGIGLGEKAMLDEMLDFLLASLTV